jgi:AcrR family transcriptional regulator
VAGTGIEHIRRAAGASPSSVYHQFRGLEEVMLALLILSFERLFAHLTARVTRTRTAKGLVHALVDGHIDWVLAHQDEARFMYQALSLELGSKLTSTLQATKAEQLTTIAEHVATFVADGSLPAWPPLLLDVVLLGPTHEACRRMLGGAPIAPNWMKKTLPRLAWQSVAKV